MQIKTFFRTSVMLLLCSVLNSHAQQEEGFDFEVTVNSDNDAFVAWNNKDIYYTYGIGLQMAFKADRFLSLEKLFPSKKTYFFKVGLRMEGYTPSNKYLTPTQIEEAEEVFDRPFAGLLYATMEANYIFENSTLKTGVLLGIMGPSSGAGELQIWFHKSLTEDALIDGWIFQLPNQLLLNFNMAYTHDFTPQARVISAFGSGEVLFGNLYMKATPSLGLRIGKFAPLTRSVAFGNGTLLNRKETELFFLVKYGVAVNGYNATAQGKLFGPKDEFALSAINTVNSLLTLGLYFSYNRWSVNFNHYFTFGSVIPKVNHTYARIGLFHRF